MANKDDYLTGYETGIKKAKTNEPGLPDRYRKSTLDKVLAVGDKFNIFENPEAKDIRLKREADDKYLDSSMGKGEAQGRAEFDKALQLEMDRSKKNPPETIPMTEKDAKIIISKEFKKASERTTDKKKGGMIKKMAKGGTASSRADGCAVRGKTKA
jgi:hypothetical protein